MNFFAKKTYLIISIFLGAAVLLSLLLFFLIRQIQSEGQKLFQARQSLDSFSYSWQNLEKAEQESDAVEDKLNQASIFLAEKDAIKFILDVEQFAQATQSREKISVISNLPQKTQGEKPTDNTLNFQISLWGSFPNLIKFLVYLENAPYLNSVDSFQIKRLSERDINPASESAGSQPGDVHSIINLSVFQ